MCTYCMMADWARTWIPSPMPFPNKPPNWPYPPLTPAPAPPAPVWPKEMLEQFEDLLRRVKALEDAAGGCPCEEPGKLDYLAEIRKLIESGETNAQRQAIIDGPLNRR